MKIKYLPISWSYYHSCAQKLAAAMRKSGVHADQIVAISRGGLTLGHILSDLMQMPVATITIQSYSDIQTHGEARLTAKLQNPVSGKHILLVDDVSDSGKTLKRAATYLRRAGATDITTVTMFYKPKSIVRPDYFAMQTTQWILFPYEPTEMILLITKSMEKSGASKARIQTFLERLKFSDNQIAFVRRHYLPTTV